MSVMASTANVTLKPSSKADRAVELHADARGDPAEDDLCYSPLVEIFAEIGAGEGSPGPLGDDVVFWLLVQFRSQIGPIRRPRRWRRLLGAARRAARDVH